METILVVLNTVALIYGLIKIVADIIIGKTWRQIRRSHEFIILILTVVITFVLLFPWRKIHYGDEIVKHDTVYKDNLPQTKRDTLLPDTTKPPKMQSDNAKIIVQKKLGQTIPLVIKSKDTSMTASKSTDRSGYTFNGGNGVYEGNAIGPNSHVDYYEGKKQRKLTYRDQQILLKGLKDKYGQIELQVSDSEETQRYGKQILLFLQSAGYTNINVSSLSTHGGNLAENIDVTFEDNIYYVSVYPQKDIK